MTAQAKKTILTPPSVVNPGVLGRTLRIVIGALQISFIYWILLNFNSFVYGQPSLVWLPYFIGILVAFRWLPDVVNLGISVRWGKQLRVGYFLILVGAAIFSLFLFGSVWGPPLGLLLFILGLYVHTHLGIAHLLAGIIATPGCEMRSYAHLATIILRKEPGEAAICPGMWTPFDRWESSIKTNK